MRKSPTTNKKNITSKQKTKAPIKSIKKSATEEPQLPKNIIKKEVKQVAPLEEKADANPFTVVAIGASAGGLEAITLLLQNLSPTTGMAFIYVQHLSPDHKSMLVPLLSKVTKMIVQEIDDMEKMKPDNVYIIPYNKEIEVTDGHIKLIPRAKNRTLNLSIDVLFSSLAETHKENVIGIVLSGSANDGTRGLKEIKEAGGITFAQDDSAKFSSMPQSAIAEGIVDFILPPIEIAKELGWISKHSLIKAKSPKKTPEEDIENSDPNLKTILQILHKKKNVDFSHYKMNTIKRRMLRRMLITKTKTIKQYVELVQQKNAELGLLYQDLLINVTDFFRDTDAFLQLKNILLPQLLKNKTPNQTLRIWVAACATGEEVYSIAILLLEIQQNKNIKIPFQIFASDLSADAIAIARTGEYSMQQLKNISPKRLQQFFTKSKDKYRIIKTLRDVCIFAQHNILTDPPFSRIDFISCRNFLIYLDTAAQKKAIATFHYALNEQGCLLLGKAETIGASVDLFNPLNKKYKTYTRKKNSGSYRLPDISTRITDPIIIDTKKMDTPAIKKTITAPHNNLSIAFDAMLLNQYVPASVIINYDMEILQFRGSTSLYLQHSSGKASFNILRMAHIEITFELRNAIHTAIKTKQIVRKTGIEMNRDIVGNALRMVNIEVSPLKLDGEEQLLIIVFTGQQMEITKQGNEGGKNNSIAKDRRIKKLEEELAAARADMGVITHDQEAVNEELQSANEEIISSNEELQSLNEELETSKEEIESTNEELTTSNQELHARIQQVEELYTYYEAIFSTVHEPVLILDKNIRIKSANKSFCKIFHAPEDECIGVSLYKLGNGQWNIPRLRELLEDVLPNNVRFHDFEVEQEFPIIGNRTLLLNAHKIVQQSINEELIVLTISDITEVKKLAVELEVKRKKELEKELEALKKVEDTNKRYHTMLMESPFAFSIMMGKNMVITLANNLMKEFWGKGKDVEGKTLLQLLPELKKQELLTIINNVFTTGIPYYANEIKASFNYEGELEDRYFNIVFQPYHEADETISGVITIAYEVTEMVFGRKIVEESEHRYRMLIDEASVATALFLGPDLRIQYANDIMITYFGKDKSVIGKTVIEAIPELKDQPFISYLKAVYATGKPYTGVEEKAEIIVNGKREISYYNYTYKALKNRQGVIYGIHQMAVDVTSSVLAKKALEESENLLKQLLNSMPQKITNADVVGNVNFFNQQWIDETGYTYEELEKNWKKTIHPDDIEHVQIAWKHAVANGTVLDLELRILNKSTGFRWNLSRAVAIKDADGKITMWVGSNTDIHEQKEAKSKAEAATQIAEQAVKSKQQFLSNMSHEIRTPMHSIIGFANVALKTNLSEKQTEYINAIKVSGESLIVLINDILDLAKVDAGKMTFVQNPFYLFPSISDMLHLFETKIQEKNLVLEKQYDTTIPSIVVGDAVRLRQIMLNLISNAVKFTTTGKITVSVSKLKEDKESVTIEFAIKDTGIGIEEKSLSSIFDTFQQAAFETNRLYGGTGLGLSIVKQLVNLQGGRVKVKSKFGKGSTFSFTLSFKKTKAKVITESNDGSKSVPKNAISKKEIGKIKVLAVEDIALNQLLIKIMVSDFGFDIDIAENGKIAIDYLEKNEYDIVLMDLLMPIMNGFETTEYIREKMKSTIPIIALTADVTTVDLKKCKSFGMNDYISKPIDEKSLYNKIIKHAKKAVEKEVV